HPLRELMMMMLMMMMMMITLRGHVYLSTANTLQAHLTISTSNQSTDPHNLFTKPFPSSNQSTHVRQHTIVHPAALVSAHCRLPNHSSLSTLTNAGSRVSLEHQGEPLSPVRLHHSLGGALRCTHLRHTHIEHLPSLRAPAPKRLDHQRHEGAAGRHQSLVLPKLLLLPPPRSTLRLRVAASTPRHGLDPRVGHGHVEDGPRAALPVLHHHVRPLVRVLHLPEAAGVLHAAQKARLPEQRQPGHRDRVMSSESLVAHWALRRQVEALRVDARPPAHARHLRQHGQVHPQPRQCALPEVLRLQPLLGSLRHARQPRSAFSAARVESQLAVSIQSCSQLQMAPRTPLLAEPMLQSAGASHHLRDRGAQLFLLFLLLLLLSVPVSTPHPPHALLVLSQALCDAEPRGLEAASSTPSWNRVKICLRLARQPTTDAT